MKNSFVLYHEYQEHFELLTNEDLGELMRAIFEYEISGEITSTLNPMQKMAFSFIKKDLDDNREKYNAKIEANKANGSKGGRPTKSENPKNPTVISETHENPNEPKKADTDYVNVNDSEIVNDNVIDPPLPPSGKEKDQTEELISDFSETMQVTMRSWLKYKRERKEPYKPEGLKQLIGQIRNSIAKYGESAMIEVMNKSMAANYTGIVFDKLQSYVNAANTGKQPIPLETDPSKYKSNIPDELIEKLKKKRSEGSG